jgi:hypothetical protein
MTTDQAAVGLNCEVRPNRRMLNSSSQDITFMPSLKLTTVLSVLPRRSYSILFLPAILAIASCGTDDGLGKRYPVSGTVTYNDKPLEKGEISFVSEDLTKNYSATGIITDGSYTLSTGGNNDGAQVGKYKVTVKAKEEFLAKAQADFQKESGRDNPKFPPTYTAKAEAAAKSLIPAGYSDPRSTTLTADVKPESNSINFKLSDAEAPPEPATTQGGTKGRGRRAE